MMLHTLLFALLFGCIQAVFQGDQTCVNEYRNAGMSRNFPENVAHAVHGQISAGLPYFNPRVGPKDVIPYFLGKRSADSNRISTNDPANEFATEHMRFLDRLMQLSHNIGREEMVTYSVVHDFHIIDLLEKIRQEYNHSVKFSPPSHQLCACLLNIGENGISNQIGKYMKVGKGVGFTNISARSLSLPMLSKPGAWNVWKRELLYYYTKPALRDAAMFLHCATPSL